MKWDDIIGLDAAKRLVKEAVVYPIKVSSRFFLRKLSKLSSKLSSFGKTSVGLVSLFPCNYSGVLEFSIFL